MSPSRLNANHKLSASRRKKRGGSFFWFLLLVISGMAGWFWWQSHQRAPQAQPIGIAKATSRITAKPMLASARTQAAPSVSSLVLTPEETTLVTNKIPSPIPSVNTNIVPPALPPGTFPRPVQNIFEAQVALVSQGISSGSIDGAIGSQTRAAIAAFQWEEGLKTTGELDEPTKSHLILNEPPYTNYTVTAEDLARLQPLSPTWLGKSQQTALDFETILELVAEKSLSHPNLIRKLNPNVNWDNVPVGTVLQVPNAKYPEDPPNAAWVTIHLAARTLEAFDSETNLLAHFPCSIAKHVEKRPVGLLHVAVIVPNPNYTFNPEIFPESEEARQIHHKLILPPGPNNPVGVAWIGLDRSGYGMHGTPSPEQVGRTESHGCFRLANWNAEFLLRMVAVGTPVYVVE